MYQVNRKKNLKVFTIIYSRLLNLNICRISFNMTILCYDKLLTFQFLLLNRSPFDLYILITIINT